MHTTRLYPDKAKLATAPTCWPVTLADAKAQMAFAADFDDALFYRLIRMAANAAEHATGRKFVTQTWDIFADAWPCFEWALPFGWLQSIDEIYYTDDNGTTTLLPSSVYDVITTKTLGRVRLAQDETWPDVVLADNNPIRIRFTCGRDFGNEWQSNTAYAENVVVIPTNANANGLAYKCTTAGTSGGTEPVWNPEIGATTTDGTVTWVSVLSVPDDVRQAILLYLADAYDERADVMITSGATLLDLRRKKMFLTAYTIKYSGDYA